MRLRAYSSRLFDRPLSYGAKSASLYLGECLCKILAKVVLHCKIEDFRGKIKKIETGRLLQSLNGAKIEND
jgi:hypothetical protein